ncbi:MAG: DUF4302 domain-containing protein [Candidatus Pedobacter colombiensis]|uniref:DUF4302 domain-containing protein n=1 Tax=Candidatus Pedobacter colombiensis TaxID=3121371 RepID=A0AAJ6B815_9SPHI|nr:DUF4302 domain-containing protein [Pedobacter sp.]WEK18633.1 MAG: DUF4302 domain-containing protein [Pedobacter sp.]
MKKQYLLLAVLSVLLFAGCDKKQDRVFDESPAARLNASIDNTYAAIKAKQAWVFSYYPGANQEYGGFNLFPNFTSAVDVTLQADYALTAQSSTFKIYAGAGPILTFDTYNSVIHYFGLPGYYTGIGTADGGMKGDFEFLVMSASPDSVVLKGRKYANLMKMRSVDVNQLPTIVANYKAAAATFNAFRTFKIEVNGTTYATTATTSTVNGSVRPNRYLNVTAKSMTISFIVTDTGIEFYKEYEIDGLKFSKLKYNAPDATYAKGYYSNTNNTMKLIPL